MLYWENASNRFQEVSTMRWRTMRFVLLLGSLVSALLTLEAGTRWH